MVKKKSRVIANMGLIGALLIVLLHVKPTPSSILGNTIVDFVYNKSSFPGIAVPLFFGISGYLLAGHVGENGWWRKSVKKRLRTLIVPFYAWTLILLLVKTILLVSTHALHLSVVTPDPFQNGLKWFFLELFGLDVFHLTGIVWYLRSLFLMVLISPVFVFTIRKGTLATVLLFLFLLIIHRYGPYSPFGYYYFDAFLANGLYCEGLFPFASGIAIKMNAGFLRGISIKWCKWGLLIWFFLVLFRYIHDNTILVYIIEMLDVLLIWGLATILNFPSWTEGISIRIYLSHMVFKWLLAFVFNILGLYTLLWNSVYFWPFNYLFVLLLTIFVIVKTRNRAPKIESILYGGR